MKRWFWVFPLCVLLVGGFVLVLLSIGKKGNGDGESVQEGIAFEEVKGVWDDGNLDKNECVACGEAEEIGGMGEQEVLDDKQEPASQVPAAQIESNEAGEEVAELGADESTPEVSNEEENRERKGSYMSIHERDEISHSDDPFEFEPISLKSSNGERDLGVFLDYVAPQNNNIKKTVMGFAPYWALDGYYQNYQMDVLSVIAYFSVGCYANGSLVTNDSGWSGWNSAALNSMVQKAHQNNVKVVLTIKNFDCPSIKGLIASSSARTILVNNLVTEVRAKGVDGVNIDFECFGTATSSERSQFASFVDQVADEIHSNFPGSHVSVDIGATSAIDPMLYDVSLLGSTSVDSIMVMTYDFHLTTYYAGKKAGPEAPLYGDQYWYTVDKSMRDIMAKAPSSKIIMGVPYYGLEFPVSGSDWLSKNATVISNGAIATYSTVVDPIYDAWHNSDTIQWDSGEKMTWYRYRWPNASTGPDYWQGYYDDANSLGAKYDYVMNNGLSGIGIWALGYDNGHTELWDVIRDKFSKDPIIVLFKSGVSRAAQAQIHSALGAEVVRNLTDESAVVVRPISKSSAALLADYLARSEVRSADYERDRGLSGN